MVLKKSQDYVALLSIGWLRPITGCIEGSSASKSTEECPMNIDKSTSRQSSDKNKDLFSSTEDLPEAAQW